MTARKCVVCLRGASYERERLPLCGLCAENWEFKEGWMLDAEGKPDVRRIMRWAAMRARSCAGAMKRERGAREAARRVAAQVREVRGTK